MTLEEMVIWRGDDDDDDDPWVNDRNDDELPGDALIIVKADTEDAVASIRVIMAMSIVVVDVFIVC